MCVLTSPNGIFFFPTPGGPGALFFGFPRVGGRVEDKSLEVVLGSKESFEFRGASSPASFGWFSPVGSHHKLWGNGRVASPEDGRKNLHFLSSGFIFIGAMPHVLVFRALNAEFLKWLMTAVVGIRDTRRC